MFTIESSIKIVSVNISYLKALYDADNEVRYSPSGYDNKKYIGILVNEASTKYVIPLSSAKEKHKALKDIGDTHLLIHETAPLSAMGKRDIYVSIDETTVKHILSVLDCKKMICLHR